MTCSLRWCIRVRSLLAPGVETCLRRSLVMLPASATSCDYNYAPLRRLHERRFDDGPLSIAICLTSPRSALRHVQAFHMTPSPAARAGSTTFLAPSTLWVSASALPNAHQKGNTHRDACQLVSGQSEGAVISQPLPHSNSPRAAVVYVRGIWVCACWCCAGAGVFIASVTVQRSNLKLTSLLVSCRSGRRHALKPRCNNA